MPDPDLDVVAIGSAIVDVLAYSSDAEIERRGMVKGTMALVDLEASEALYATMPAATEASGGSAANTAAGMASFGGRTGFIGKVRDDQLGHVFVHDIRSVGVEYATPPTTTGAPTGRCLVMVSPDGERTMNTFLGAAVELDSADIDEAMVGRAAVTYLEGYMWDPPEAIEALRKAIAVAHGSGRRVALSLSDPFCVDRHRAEFQTLLADEVDILFGNETEVISLFEVASLHEAVRSLPTVCELSVVTRGPAGSTVVTSAGAVEVPAAPVDRVVDTTGAGDLFAAGFLYGLSRSFDPVRSAQLGGLAAAECIAHIGARPMVALHTLATPAGEAG